MEIFGIGLPEIIMVAVVALIVLGPERLPEAARTIGKGVADFRRAIEPARSAWTDLSSEFTSAVTSATSATSATPVQGTKADGNPWDVHPILQKMTDEERAIYMRGGEMPQRVQQELAESANIYTNGHSPNGNGSLPELDYPMPHSEMIFQPAPQAEAEDLSYPEPGTTTQKEKEEK